MEGRSWRRYTCLPGEEDTRKSTMSASRASSSIMASILPHPGTLVSGLLVGSYRCRPTGCNFGIYNYFNGGLWDNMFSGKNEIRYLLYLIHTNNVKI